MRSGNEFSQFLRLFLPTLEDFGLKIGRHCCLNEYMKTVEYTRPRSFFDL